MITVDTLLAFYGIALAIVGLGVAIALVEASAGEFWVARSFFILSALLMAISTIYWIINTDMTWLPRFVIGCVAGVLLCVGLPESIRWINGRESKSASQKEPTPAPLLASQIQEITKLQEFIGGKNEESLDRLFDFYDMLRYNIKLSSERYMPNLTTKEQSRENK